MMENTTRYRQLSYEERVAIATMQRQGMSVRKIAHAVGRSPNTVSRELREKRVKGRYTPKKAQHKTYWRRYQSKQNCMNVALDPVLASLVCAKLKEGWSPERVAGYATRMGMRISKKAVYKYVRSRCLERYLFWQRHRRKRGRKRGWIHPRDTAKKLVALRPPTTCSGHWELDFVVSRKSSAVLLVLVDRWTRYTIVRKLRRKTHRAVRSSLVSVKCRYTFRSISTDNDVVFVRWQELETTLATPFYFTRPYTSQDKGLVENTNRWIRTLVPKGTDINTVSHATLRDIHTLLNKTPRQVLGYRTTEEVLLEAGCPS